MLKFLIASSCILGMTWEYISIAFPIPLKRRYERYRRYIKILVAAILIEWVLLVLRQVITDLENANAVL